MFDGGEPIDGERHHASWWWRFRSEKADCSREASTQSRFEARMCLASLTVVVVLVWFVVMRRGRYQSVQRAAIVTQRARVGR